MSQLNQEERDFLQQHPITKQELLAVRRGGESDE